MDNTRYYVTIETIVARKIGPTGEKVQINKGARLQDLGVSNEWLIAYSAQHPGKLYISPLEQKKLQDL